jgi:N-carbamoylputrescine amidase
VIFSVSVCNIYTFALFFMVHRMQKLAKELDVVIPLSFFEEAGNAHYNSVAIIDADGTDLGLYRKSHIPDGPGMMSLQ